VAIKAIQDGKTKGGPGGEGGEAARVHGEKKAHFFKEKRRSAGSTVLQEGLV